jgi:LysR family transcriptional regulator, low CO2-responsive transcriptional regulator
MRPSLHQLRVFEAVARLASFTGAARELHSTQPTVSVQMRDLAQQVGLPLFEVGGRRVALTAAGEALLGTVREMTRAWQIFESNVGELKGLRRGVLKLAAVTTAEYFIPELLAPFVRAYPGIEVRLAVENRDKIVLRLEQDLDDVVVMMMPPAHLMLEATPFLENPLVALAPKAHPLARRARVTLAAFAAQPLLMREKGSGTRMASEQLFTEHKLVPNVRMELGSNEAIKHAVAAGLGLAILSRHTLGRTPQREGLAVLSVQHLPIKRTWYLVQRQGRTASPAVRAFIEFVGERLRAAAAKPHR